MLTLTMLPAPQAFMAAHALPGVTVWIGNTTGGSIRTLVRTARRYREVQIQAGEHTITAADPRPKTSATLAMHPRRTRTACVGLTGPATEWVPVPSSR